MIGNTTSSHILYILHIPKKTNPATLRLLLLLHYCLDLRQTAHHAQLKGGQMLGRHASPALACSREILLRTTGDEATDDCLS